MLDHDRRRCWKVEARAAFSLFNCGRGGIRRAQCAPTTPREHQQDEQQYGKAGRDDQGRQRKVEMSAATTDLDIGWRRRCVRRNIPARAGAMPTTGRNSEPTSGRTGSKSGTRRSTARRHRVPGRPVPSQFHSDAQKRPVGLAGPTLPAASHWAFVKSHVGGEAASVG